MTNINIRRIIYHIRHRYVRQEYIVAVVIVFIALWFIVGSVGAMQRNYELRHRLEERKRSAKLIELEAATLEYEQRYLRSEEYQKLAVRQKLGKGDPGERVLILPKNSPQAKQADDEYGKYLSKPRKLAKPSNVSQWVNFLFGGNVESLEREGLQK